jgi:hypothetical protein
MLPGDVIIQAIVFVFPAGNGEFWTVFGKMKELQDVYKMVPGQ